MRFGGGEGEGIGERNDSPSLSLFFCSHSSPSHSHSLFKTLFMYPAKRSFPLHFFRYTDLNNITTLIYDSYGALHQEKIYSFTQNKVKMSR